MPGLKLIRVSKMADALTWTVQLFSQTAVEVIWMSNHAPHDNAI